MMTKTTTTLRRRGVLSVVVVACLLLVIMGPRVVDAALACASDQDCTSQLRQGSFCVDGFCSNPFVQGCLTTMHKSNNNQGKEGEEDDSDRSSNTSYGLRVCNSDDEPFLLNCIPNEDFDYPEIRIHNGNWESSIFYAWILQILLMEIARVPVTVGLTSDTTLASSFYAPQNTLEYSSKAYPFEALTRAEKCHLTSRECVHVLPEVWNGQQHEWTKALQLGYIDPVEGNGQVGKGSWYVPGFTAARDDSLVSFYGLRGEENRAKNAASFLKPTTWLEYCLQVSSTNCTTPDDTAQQFPSEEQQQNMYFANGLYTGHFRMTEENNCTLYPDTCMGHIIGPGCEWSTNIDAQLYWNDIVSLKPDGPLMPNGGYDYASLIEIWRAANATQSNVIMWWWRPEALVEEFHGTDSQFQQVLLPEATDICSRARVDTKARCSDDINLRRGDPLGACDQEAHALQKIFSSELQTMTNAVDNVASRSPGYDIIKAVKITDLEINNMLRRWLTLNTDKYGNDAREAVCSWVVENLDRLLDAIPPGYPRVLESSNYQAGWLYGAVAMAAMCILFVLGITAMAYHWRQCKVFVYAQQHIVFQILFGFVMILVGAIMMALEPSAGVCIAQSWLINLGYTIELVPLLVKVAAINKILSSAQRMKRVKIDRQSMLLLVGAVVLCVVIFQLCWTLIDPPQRVEERHLVDEHDGMVEISFSCASNSNGWYLTALAWQGLLLLMATVLAVQSRHVIQEFNESQRLGTLIYSQFMFLILRAVVYQLGREGIFPTNVSAGVVSYLLSCDSLFASIIYFVPKCLEAKVAPSDYKESGRRGSVHASAALNNIERAAAAEHRSYVLSQNASRTTDVHGNTIHSGEQSDKFHNIYSNKKAEKFPSTSSAGSSSSHGMLRTNLDGSLSGVNSFRFRRAHLMSQLKEASAEFDEKGSSEILRGGKNTNHQGTTSASMTSPPPPPPPLRKSSSRKSPMSSPMIGILSKKSASSPSLKTTDHKKSPRWSNNNMSAINSGGGGSHHDSNQSFQFHLKGGGEESFYDSDYVDDDDSDNESEEMLRGGPRFANPRVNREFEKSIRMPSSQDVMADLYDDEDDNDDNDTSDHDDSDNIHDSNNREDLAPPSAIAGPLGEQQAVECNKNIVLEQHITEDLSSTWSREEKEEEPSNNNVDNTNHGDSFLDEALRQEQQREEPTDIHQSLEQQPSTGSI